MGLFTSEILKTRSAQKNFSERQSILMESKKTHSSFDIFLSHSYLDKDEVEGLYLRLKDLGYSVYVDWIVDPDIDRSRVTKQSAELIRSRMKSSKSLLLAISENAALSKWIPWELGFVDANTGKCAILPVSKSNYQPKTFARFEYLLLYPYIKLAQISYREELYVVESADMFVSIENWLRRSEKPTYKNVNINLL